MARKFVRRKFKRRPRRRFKRRVFRRKRNGVSTWKLRGPVPDQIFVQLKFSENLAYAPAAGVSSQNTWRANSVFDPDFTGVGAQPRYFDQYAALYNSYQVMACKVKHELVNTGIVPVYVATCFTDIDPSALSLQNTVEQRYGKSHGVLGALTGNGQRVISRYITMKKLHGFSGGISQVESLQAAVTGNPTDPSFHKIVIQPCDESSNATVNIRSTFTYYVKFFSLINIAAS